MRRAVLLLGVVFALAACHQRPAADFAAAPSLTPPAPAYSTQPLLTRGAGGAVLHPGVWRASVDGCAVDERAPARSWPACAAWTLVAGDRLVGVTPEGREVSRPFVLSVGAPRLLQIPEDFGAAHPRYLYDVLTGLRTDAGGRIIAFTRAPVECQQPATGAAAGPGQRGCLANSADVVLNAAQLGAGGLGVRFHWVRDGES